MDDNRFERELKHKEVLQKQADHGASKDAEQVRSALLSPPFLEFGSALYRKLIRM